MLKINTVMSAVVFVWTDCYTVVPYDTECNLFVIAKFVTL